MEDSILPDVLYRDRHMTATVLHEFTNNQTLSIHCNVSSFQKHHSVSFHNFYTRSIRLIDRNRTWCSRPCGLHLTEKSCQRIEWTPRMPCYSLRSQHWQWTLLPVNSLWMQKIHIGFFSENDFYGKTFFQVCKLCSC